MKYLLPSIAALCLWLAGSLAFRYTILPVDHYSMHPYVYEQGNSIKLRNSYLTDIADVLVPWKSYIAQYPERVCEASLPGVPGGISGVSLPNDYCYPFQAVRHFSFSDSFFYLSRALPFFIAYELSYFFLLLSLLLGGFFFFREILRDHLLPGSDHDFLSAFASTLFAFSFPVARELQYDGITQGIPFLLVATALLYGNLRSFSLLRATIAALALALAFWKSSLQCLGIYGLFAALFPLVWGRAHLRANGKKAMLSIFGTLVPAVVAGLWLNRGAIVIFLGDQHSFLPVREPAMTAVLLRRFAGWVLSFMHFLGGDLLFSFSTVDFSKAIGVLGSREVFSYDGNAYFLSPFAAVLLLLAIAALVRGGEKKSVLPKAAWGALALIFLIDLLVVLLPTYRLLYFRFHQWWMAANFTVFLSLALAGGAATRASRRGYAALLGGAFFACAALFLVIGGQREFVLGKLGTGGMVGFEPGFWPARFEAWLRRISFRDFYSLAFFALAAGSVLALRAGRKRTLVGITAAGSLALNVFHYNRPQPVEPFQGYVDKIRRGKEARLPESGGRPFARNVSLLVGMSPESLNDSLYLGIPKDKAEEQK